MESEAIPNRNFWRGQLVRLRATEQKDLDAIAAGLEEPDTELERFEDAIGFPLSPEQDRVNTQELMARSGKEDFVFCVIENHDREVVGYINSFDCSPRDGTFKYAIVIKHRFWRQGYGSEAVRILLRYFFYELRYQKCTALVYAFNERSQRFHESLGFRLEGRLRNMHYTNGQVHDELYYGMTLDEWKAIDPPAILQ